MDLAKKIHEREAKVAVIGIGYVGLPLSIEIARAAKRVAASVMTVWLVVPGRSFSGW